ncbi:Hsp70 family protein [Chloroflexia bacterium SDU3-3]|nr:Hsp70 family protein [Chloroflexia bacterium SDU3-3]
MRVGLDFGTTNSSAAIYRDGRISLLNLDPVNASPTVMRSTLFITREGVPSIGREAINRFAEGNVGREIEYEWRYIGEAEVTMAEVGTVMQSLYAVVDTNTPGRLFQSLKSHLRDSSFTGTDVFGTRYTLEALIGIVLKMILTQIEKDLGEKVEGMVVGRPVHYAHDPRLDALAISRMRQAAELAGLPPITFLPEPTAAALAYASTAHEQQHILVFDFGGGTLDVTVMRIDGKGNREVLATDGVPIGGDLLDRRIVMGKLLPHFGAGATLGARKLPLPAVLLDHLSEWQSIVDLTQPRYLDLIDEAIRTGDKPHELQALRTLVRENYGLPMYEAVERAKVGLSDARETAISMHVPGIDFDEPLERWDFNRLIGPDVREVGACIDRALEASGKRPADIDVVLRTGGSSRIPRFVTLLTEKFGAEKLREMDVFTGVASGLAVAAGEEVFWRQLAEEQSVTLT